MIIKPRNIPLTITYLQYLLQRLKTNHSATPQLEELLYHQQAGWNGEQSLDFHLDYLKDPHYILHNLRLFDGHHFFQIDTLILFPSFILVIEVKNMKGQITIHRERKEMRRDMEGFQDPVEQAERQMRLLRDWLDEHLDLKMPIVFLVVFTNKRCTLEFDTFDSRIHEKVIRSTSLLDAINLKRRTRREKELQLPELVRIGRGLTSANEERIPNYMKQFSLQYSDLQKGVRCPKCGRYFMIRSGLRWLCDYCSFHSYTAHESALREYATLIQTTISNTEARDFLQIQSRHVAYRLLNRYAKGIVGVGRGVRYQLEWSDSCAKARSRA